MKSAWNCILSRVWPHIDWSLLPFLVSQMAVKIHFEVHHAYLLLASEAQQLDQWVWQVPAPLHLGLRVTKLKRVGKNTDYNNKGAAISIPL